jgi:hypothetical protein
MYYATIYILAGVVCLIYRYNIYANKEVQSMVYNNKNIYNPMKLEYHAFMKNHHLSQIKLLYK